MGSAGSVGDAPGGASAREPPALGVSGGVLAPSSADVDAGGEVLPEVRSVLGMREACEERAADLEL